MLNSLNKPTKNKSQDKQECIQKMKEKVFELKNLKGLMDYYVYFFLRLVYTKTSTLTSN